jgi:hypothetical protein
MGGPAGWYPGRCKDCAQKAAKGRSRCDDCAEARRKAAAERRARLKRAKRCTVCGEPARVVDGVVMTTCERHGRYYREREEERRNA